VLKKRRTSLHRELYEYDTSAVSDALDSLGIEGCLLGIRPLSNGRKMLGPAYTVRYLPYDAMGIDGSLYKNAGNYIDEVPRDAVIIIDNGGRLDCTTWGDILTRVSISRGIAGTVVYGAVRDFDFIYRSEYPVYSSSVYMRSGKNRVYKSEQQCLLKIGNVTISPGDIIFGDENGAVVIPKDNFADVMVRVKNIYSTEKSIINAIEDGMSLQEARKIFRYDQPWLEKEGV
jgi:regulator of RNase E activity RraA